MVERFEVGFSAPRAAQGLVRWENNRNRLGWQLDGDDECSEGVLVKRIEDTRDNTSRHLDIRTRDV